MNFPVGKLYANKDAGKKRDQKKRWNKDIFGKDDMIQCVASNPTVKQILREEGCDLRWKPGGVGRNGGQYMWVNLNVDETSRLSGSQPDALYTTGRNVPALLSLTHRLHFLPAQDLYRRCSLGLNALPCSYTPLPSINSHSALRYQLHFHIPPGVWSEDLHLPQCTVRTLNLLFTALTSFHHISVCTILWSGSPFWI